MLKLFGAVLIISCGAACGAAKAHALELKARYLSDMALFIKHLQTDLSCRQSDSLKALSEAAANLKYLPLKFEHADISKNLKRGIMASCDSLPESAKNEVFVNALMLYGTGETEVIYKNLEYAYTVLNAQAQAEAEKLQNDKKLYASMGLFAGIITALLLI